MIIIDFIILVSLLTVLLWGIELENTDGNAKLLSRNDSTVLKGLSAFL